MASDESIQPAAYELPPPQELPVEAEIKGSERSLPEPLLMRKHCGSAGSNGW